VPVRVPRVLVERRLQCPSRAVVRALENAGRLRACEQSAVCGGDARDFRQLALGVVPVRQTLARLGPGLAEIGAAPDGCAVPFAGRGRIERTSVVVVEGVVDRRALAERASQLPVT